MARGLGVVCAKVAALVRMEAQVVLAWEKYSVGVDEAQ
jgi:hypothetical protein